MEELKILDSGERRQFETGAVRDICEGKGRCDLLPLDIIAGCLIVGLEADIINKIVQFRSDGRYEHLLDAIDIFALVFINKIKERHPDLADLAIFTTAQKRIAYILLEVSMHFEEGVKKYGENNWQKGIPVHCYIDSALRHFLKFVRGDRDEPHDRAFVWNLLCCAWTMKHIPELDDFTDVGTAKMKNGE